MFPFPFLACGKPENWKPELASDMVKGNWNILIFSFIIHIEKNGVALVKLSVLEFYLLSLILRLEYDLLNLSRSWLIVLSFALNI